MRKLVEIQFLPDAGALGQGDRRRRVAAIAGIVASALLAGVVQPAAANIINGQFTAAVTDGHVTTFDPSTGGAVATTPIAPGTTLTGTFRIDTSLLPAGVTSVIGNPATSGSVLTTVQQTGGAQWLTVSATLGLATPVALSFQRDPSIAKPADAVGFTAPSFSQELDYARGFAPALGAPRCCDFLAIHPFADDSYFSTSLNEGVSYTVNFIMSFEEEQLLLAGAGVPVSGNFDAALIDPLTNNADAFTVGQLDSLTTVAPFVGGAFVFDEIEYFANFHVLTASFDTTVVTEPPAAALLLAIVPLLARRDRNRERVLQ